MPATSQITFVAERHSFISEQQSTEKHDAPKRIPRPPNAFMLYRSDFIKTRAVPPEVEKRQQNLSRIAGQCWNMLPETEKAIWFSKAAVIRAEHRAKYPLYEAGPFRKDTNRLSAKDKRRGSATNVGRSSGRTRTRRTRTPYCEGMFAALHDSRISSPESQASLISPTLASESPLSTTPSLSPISLPHLLPSFISHAPPSRQDSPSATSVSPTNQKGEFGYLLDSAGSESPQWDLIRDLEITPSEIGSSPEPCVTLQQYEAAFASYVPRTGLEDLPNPLKDPVAQVSLTPSIFPPAGRHLADCHSFVQPK
ncbi:hypothetical protein OG21DRAFT_994548 [Imleria badia]|nr:hypothetical protein OG21DRAFT_994548 [Imleria badia]